MPAESVILIPLLLQLFGLLFAVLSDSYIKKKHKRVMFVIILLVFILIVQNCMEHLLTIQFFLPKLRIIVGIIGYTIRPIILLMFFYIVDDAEKHIPFWILIAVNFLVTLTALFSDICFTIDANNHFKRGALGYTTHIVSGIMILYLLYLTLRNIKITRKAESLIPISNVVFIIAAVILDMSDLQLGNICYVTFLTIAIVSGSLFYYIWLHLQFVREHEQALIAEQRIQIMMTQIQPHFLYNTLSTIQALCMIDPKKAFDVTERFGTYLRQNLNSLGQTDLIPFQKELEHTKIYSEIESVRFPNITVEYDIPETNFSLPALTVQPLVENAIRHGVRIRKEGKVKVSTAKTPYGYEITIEDNGKGFDTTIIETADNTHIGLRNVQERIEKMCHGTLRIESKKDIGTKIIIFIPKLLNAKDAKQ